MTWPVAPPVPMRAMSARIRSLAVTPRTSRAVDLDREASSACAGSRHWVASTWPTSLVPMPKASAPKAPWVLVWLSPQTMVMPGWVRPSSGPITCTMPCRSSPSGVEADAEVAAVRVERLRPAPPLRRPGPMRPPARGVVGVEWSMVATVRSGRRTRKPALAAARRTPAARSPRGRGAGRRRARRACPAVAGATTCASQTFSNSVRGRLRSCGLRGRARRAAPTAERYALSAASMVSVLAAWPVDSRRRGARAPITSASASLPAVTARVCSSSSSRSRPSAASAALRPASSGPFPTAEAERRCAVHLDLDGRGGQDLVARERLVAHQPRPRARARATTSASRSSS